MVRLLLMPARPDKAAAPQWARSRRAEARVETCTSRTACRDVRGRTDLATAPAKWAVPPSLAFAPSRRGGEAMPVGINRRAPAKAAAAENTMRPLLAVSEAIDLLNEKVGDICNFLVLL